MAGDFLGSGEAYDTFLDFLGLRDASNTTKVHTNAEVDYIRTAFGHHTLKFNVCTMMPQYGPVVFSAKVHLLYRLCSRVCLLGAKCRISGFARDFNSTFLPF